MVFCSEDHKCSPVAPQHGDLCPCCTGRAVSLVSGSLCLVFGVRLWSTILRIFMGFRKYLRIQHFPVRQWIHVRRQSTRSYGSISHVFHVFDVPVVVQRQVHGQTVQVAVLVPLLRLKSLALLSGRSCRFSWSPTEILPHSCAVLHGHWRCTCPSLCNDRCRVVDDLTFIDGFRRPCDHAET